jgi:hypothetical protein
MSLENHHWPSGLLAAWLLMVPPYQEGRLGSVEFDPKTPIAKWTQKSRHESENACEQERVSRQRLASLDAPDDSWSALYAAARCLRDPSTHSAAPSQ